MAVRILVIDDDKALATITARMLETAGYLADKCHDPQEALVQVTGGAYQLLVMDVMMPGMDGFQLCELLREKGWDLPILFLTAKATALDVLKGRAAGGNDYLCKPYERQELLDKVKQLAGEPSPGKDG